MRTIVHLSDLHFGKVDEALLTPLVKAVGALVSDVAVASGERWRRETEHIDKWKVCDNNPGLRPERAGRP